MDKLGTQAPKYFYAFIVLIVLWQIARLILKIGGLYSRALDMPI